MVGVSVALLELYAAVHLSGHSHGGLIDRLIVEHQAHVAVQAYRGLLATPQSALEVFGEIECAMHLLLADELFGIVKRVAHIGHLHVRACVVVTDELA